LSYLPVIAELFICNCRRLVKELKRLKKMRRFFKKL